MAWYNRRLIRVFAVTGAIVFSLVGVTQLAVTTTVTSARASHVLSHTPALGVAFAIVQLALAGAVIGFLAGVLVSALSELARTILRPGSQ